MLTYLPYIMLTILHQLWLELTGLKRDLWWHVAAPQYTMLTYLPYIMLTILHQLGLELTGLKRSL